MHHKWAQLLTGACVLSMISSSFWIYAKQRFGFYIIKTISLNHHTVTKQRAEQQKHIAIVSEFFEVRIRKRQQTHDPVISLLCSFNCSGQQEKESYVWIPVKSNKPYRALDRIHRPISPCKCSNTSCSNWQCRLFPEMTVYWKRIRWFNEQKTDSIFTAAVL